MAGCSVLLLAVAGGGVAVWQWRAATRATKQAELNQARSSGLYSLSLLNEGKDLEGWIEAIRAGTLLQKHQTIQPEGVNALQQAISKSNKTRTLNGHGDRALCDGIGIEL